ncbi:hypothetical protein EG328_011925 [Venturia inaequalis]|uniref:Uncharacterized protein n=1 Tax=Venturia inaequalis TaxID=5025 RepID=A0A8H3U3U7_VENIN|nr:hypothetical protein EG328_011925 [Venturia inaequalis]
MRTMLDYNKIPQALRERSQFDYASTEFYKALEAPSEIVAYIYDYSDPSTVEYRATRMTIELALVIARSKTGIGKYSKVEKEKRKAKREVKSAPLITLIEKEDLQAQEKHGVIIPYQQRLLNARRKYDEEVAAAQIKLSIIVIATSSKIAKTLAKAAIPAKAVPTKLASTPAKLVSTPVKSAKIPRSKRVSTKILDISSDDSGKAPISKRKLAVAISSEGTPSKSSRLAKKTKLDSSSNEELVKTLAKSEVTNIIFGDTTDEEISPTIKAARNLFNNTDEEVPAATEEVIAAESSTGSKEE